VGESDELKRNILEQIAKTGYPLEIVTATTLERRGWLVWSSPAYLDEEEGKGREIDVKAVRYASGSASLRIGVPAVRVVLIIECKKSEKPWVFFVRAEGYRDPWPAELHCFSRLTNLLPAVLVERPVVTMDWLVANHHYFRDSRLARTYFEPSRKDTEKRAQAIYAAASCATKACLYELARMPPNTIDHVFAYPVIVFDGPLFEATMVAENDSVSLTRARHVRLAFDYILKAAPESRWARDVVPFIVDVITRDYLSDYADMVEESSRELARYLAAEGYMNPELPSSLPVLP
jgi:hypothetical protein